MYTITPFDAYIVLFGYMGWPLTLLAAIGFAWLGYRAKTLIWRIILWGLAAFFAFPLFMFWLYLPSH